MRNTIYLLIGSFVLLTSFTYYSRQYQARLRADAELSRNLIKSFDWIEKSNRVQFDLIKNLVQKQPKYLPFRTCANRIHIITCSAYRSLVGLGQCFEYDEIIPIARNSRDIDCAALLRLHDSLNRRFVALGSDSLLLAQKIKIPFDAVYEHNFQSGIGVLPYKNKIEQFAWFNLELGHWQNICAVLLADLVAHAMKMVKSDEYRIFEITEYDRRTPPHYPDRDISFEKILIHSENIKMYSDSIANKMDSNLVYYTFLKPIRNPATGQ